MKQVLHNLRCVSLVGFLATACQSQTRGSGGGAGHRGGGAAGGFDGQRAFSYIQDQMGFGPRIPGTRGHDQAGDWLLARLRERADTVIVQDIDHRLRNGTTLHLRNFLARFRPSAGERVLYLAHWDTRPTSDQARTAADRRRPVPGANDGASGVAVLLGVADALKAKPSSVGVDLLFVDGEDYGDFADTTDVLIGARWFSTHPPAGYPPLLAVLFDMVGDSGLRIPVEQNSLAGAPEVVERVWRAAEELGYGNVFVRTPGPILTDDHVALQRAGIHAIDVVDFDYGPGNGYWHTPDDTIDKVSARSLQTVGDVALAVIRSF